MGFLIKVLLALKAFDKLSVFKDEEVDKQMVDEKAKDRKETSMRAMTMMWRITDYDEVGIPMMKKSIDDYD